MMFPDNVSSENSRKVTISLQDLRILLFERSIDAFKELKNLLKLTRFIVFQTSWLETIRNF